MTQNLLEPHAEDQNYSVNVEDHDDENVLPHDIASNESAAAVALWKQPSVKIWLYILGGAVAVFAVVFVVLSQQSSLFKGSTLDSTSTNSGDEGLFFSDYNATSGTTDSSTTPNTISTTGDETIVDQTEQNTTPSTDYSYDDSIYRTSDYADQPSYDPNEFLGTTYGTVSDNFGYGDPADGYNSAGELPEVTDNSNGNVPAEGQPATDANTSDSPSLETNTSGMVMVAPEVQGDTGPAVWISLLPALFYTVYRSKRRI